MVPLGVESKGICSDTGHIDEDCGLNLTGHEPEEQTWLQSKNLRNYSMKRHSLWALENLVWVEILYIAEVSSI